MSRLQNELNSTQNVQDLFLRLDEMNERKRQQYFEDAEEPQTLTSQVVRWRAQMLYSALKGLDGPPR